MRLSGKEKVAYGLGAVGKDMVYMLSASYVLYYYQDILGVSAFAMGIILLIARIFDAFNDPIMGVVVAKTKTKWGKFRPWLLIGTVTNAVMLYLLYAAPPSLAGNGLVAYAAVFYILWGVTYTMMDIPYWSMVPAFTESGKERESLSALARSCAGVGSALVSIVAIISVKAIGSAIEGADAAATVIERTGFKWLSLIIAVLFILFTLITCICIKEKSSVDMETASVKDMFRALLQNDQAMTKVFQSAEISYVKWDMNRIISDYYSKSLDKERQKEVGHRYVLGLYRCMKELTERFPHILFEGCASGGNRFDLGILCYFPQVWASDNTDAICRANMQTNYSYGYPMNTVAAHVSGIPNHQTLRKTPLETRFHVASFGVLGYECNLCDLKKEEKEAIAQQIELYKKWRSVMQFGSFYRTRTFDDKDSDGNQMQWTVVSKDQKKAIGLMLQKLAVPNWQYASYAARGLKEDVLYDVSNRDVKINIKEFGDLINTVVPVHIKQDSLVHNVAAKFVKMDSAKEQHKMYGDTLMYAGMKCKQGFSGTGYNEEVRYYQDFGTQLYFMEEC